MAENPYKRKKKTPSNISQPKTEVKNNPLIQPEFEPNKFTTPKINQSVNSSNSKFNTAKVDSHNYPNPFDINSNTFKPVKSNLSLNTNIPSSTIAAKRKTLLRLIKSIKFVNDDISFYHMENPTFRSETPKKAVDKLSLTTKEQYNIYKRKKKPSSLAEPNFKELKRQTNLENIKPLEDYLLEKKVNLLNFNHSIEKSLILNKYQREIDDLKNKNNQDINNLEEERIYYKQKLKKKKKLYLTKEKSEKILGIVKENIEAYNSMNNIIINEYYKNFLTKMNNESEAGLSAITANNSAFKDSVNSSKLSKSNSISSSNGGKIRAESKKKSTVNNAGQNSKISLEKQTKISKSPVPPLNLPKKGKK
ncbi:MAG: hypothetical protein MJ252_02755 [archaeon]|nr:hypothetical protein [archaeon]